MISAFLALEELFQVTHLLQNSKALMKVMIIYRHIPSKLFRVEAVGAVPFKNYQV